MSNQVTECHYVSYLQYSNQYMQDMQSACIVWLAVLQYFYIGYTVPHFYT